MGAMESVAQMGGGCPPRCFEIRHPDGSYECDCNEFAPQSVESTAKLLCPVGCWKVWTDPPTCDCHQEQSAESLQMGGLCPRSCFEIRHPDGSYECGCNQFAAQQSVDSTAKILCPVGCRQVMTDPPTCDCHHNEEPSA